MKKYYPGNIVDCKVIGIKPYGVFVSLDDQTTGLVHISEISSKYIKHPLDELRIGQIVKVKVISVDVKKRRIGLSIKQAK